MPSFDISFKVYSDFIGSLKKYLKYPKTIDGFFLNLEDNPASLLSNVIGLKLLFKRKY